MKSEKKVNNLTNTSPRQPRRARNHKSHILPGLLIVLAFVIAAIAGAIFASSSLLDKSGEPPAEDGLLTAHDKAVIMIEGVDQREDDVGRSDTLMVATVDPRQNRVALLSVPRDTRVKIQGHGWDKINAAYAYGGEKLSQRTLEDFLGVNMDHYVIINTHAFQKIIDAIGGVDIDVEKRMYYADPWDDDGGLVIDLQPGRQHMDGKTAVTYVRYRDEEGDIGRIKRQQKFMKACMDKVTSPSIIPKLPIIIKECLSAVKTDLSFRQMLELAGTLRDAQKNGLKTDMVPGKPMYIKGISYWIPDVQELRSTIAKTLGINITGSARLGMERAAEEYKSSIPSDAKELPNDSSIGRPTPSSGSSQSRRESGLKRETPAPTAPSRQENSTRKTQETPQDLRSEDTAASQSRSQAPSSGGTQKKGQ